ncbi:major facilitator superfamily domain-containing protein 6 [Drosophila grimshawi]|uniref:GH21150 n=1 Tax=Drosophila grimshawi TaxID=7222 RepID=B4J6L4_DROGR|nr:major facilitator superfamily domain-containing protein 6 [Drosophila grimshawi]XP_032590191.1 major facilitator superfamily domain-containing protein 6 [Drosophila grimshawi]EDW00917.1 GH21150 [Drosophila grimshawi]
MNPYNTTGGAGGGDGAANPFGAPTMSAGYSQQQQQGYGYEEQSTSGYDQGGGAGYGQQQQAAGYGPPGARPRVDVEATGEVDPNLYPEAKDSTHKVRGTSGVLEMFFGATEQELIPVKSFYFFFYAAFGSLFPLMGVYFKQMGMNPGQCGILVGMRPFVEFLSAPFWGSYADRCRQGKKLLLASLACWVLFTIPLSFIRPEAINCIERRNATDFVLTYTRTKRDTSAMYEPISQLDQDPDSSMLDDEVQSEEGHSRRKRSLLLPRIDAGISPVHINFVSNYDNKHHRDYVTPIFSSMVYRTPDIQKAFFLLLLVILIGEFFSAPAITLADSAVITLLGEDADKYGHQRMFGSLGWGISMFLVGIALDHSTSFSNHPCGAGNKEKNYNICFSIFSVLMTCAIISAAKITFKYEPVDESQQQMQAQFVDPNKKAEEDSMNQLAAQLNLPSLAVGSGSAASGACAGGVSSFIAGGHQAQPHIGAESKVFAQTAKEMPEWMTVLTHFKDLKTASFLFVAWFMGFGIGLIFTFLFWHLQDYGGTPTLFGVASVINHVSEIFAYFFSFRLITQIGHVKVLCLGLIGNVLRFLYISYLTNPWMVLPFELMQGITHAAVWAASCSYIAHNTPKHLRSSGQGVLQGIHHGLGRGCGAIIGGMFVTYYGTTATFRWYGIACLFVLGLFIFINFYRKEQGFISDIPVTEDPHQVAEETSHLAPHGVPSNPIPRALSNTRLNEMNPNGGPYGTYQTTGGNLDIPGASAHNPFAQ